LRYLDETQGSVESTESSSISGEPSNTNVTTIDTTTTSTNVNQTQSQQTMSEEEQ